MTQRAEQLIDARIQDLYQNTDFVSTIFRNLTGYAIIAADFDGDIIAYNEGARKTFKYAPSEIIGKQSVALFFRRGFVEAGELQSIIASLIEDGTVSFEQEMVRKDDGGFPARILFTLTRDKGGKLVGFIGIVEDLTILKRAEQLETENRERAARIEELEGELRSMERLSSSGQLSVTASLYGASPLEKANPDVAERLAGRYEELLDMALENRAFKVEHNVSAGLRALAQEFGSVRAGPRDVFDVYRIVVKKKREDATTQKANAVLEEGRLTVLELMGYLVSYYRSYASKGQALSHVKIANESSIHENTGGRK